VWRKLDQRKEIPRSSSIQVMRPAAGSYKSQLLPWLPSCPPPPPPRYPCTKRTTHDVQSRSDLSARMDLEVGCRLDPHNTFSSPASTIDGIDRDNVVDAQPPGRLASAFVDVADDGPPLRLLLPVPPPTQPPGNPALHPSARPPPICFEPAENTQVSCLPMHN
jgi:hypothetical protein